MIRHNAVIVHVTDLEDAVEGFLAQISQVLQIVGGLIQRNFILDPPYPDSSKEEPRGEELPFGQSRTFPRCF